MNKDLIIFSKNEKARLKTFLYGASYIHDARILEFIFENDNAVICLKNNYYSCEAYVTFYQVESVIFDCNDIWGDNEEISSLTLEEKCPKDLPSENDTLLTFLIEKHSGKKIYITCQKISFSI